MNVLPPAAPLVIKAATKVAAPAAATAPTHPPTQLARLRRAVESGESRAATHVPIEAAFLGDDAVELIATSGAFPALVELTLGAVTDAGLRRLATTAVGLARLESVHLGEDRDVSRISARAIDALAHSTRLPALRRISRTITHHVYGAGARDDTEVHMIQRDDGRVVESVIDHCLWP
ncbi:MAG: hypothetical protein ACKV2T_08170 [Kofleriaceae bacterium]